MAQKTNLILSWSGLVLIVFIFFEVSSYIVYSFVLQPGAKFLVYEAPNPLKETRYERYLQERHEVIGWPQKKELFTSRPTPSFPVAGNEKISLYGDSFVFGLEVGDAEAWGNILSDKLKFRIANFGVSGYGTDQAYLRFKLNKGDSAETTILGILPQNVLRNVNQYRFCLTGEELYGFKPRFILEDGALVQIPIPTIPFEELPTLYREPAQYLKHETFLPDSEYGPARMSFPFSFALSRLVMRERILNWITDKPSWQSFLQPGHESQSMELTSAIAAAFKKECDRRNKKFALIIFPTVSSYKWYSETGSLITQSFIHDLQQKGIRVLDLTKGFKEKLKDRNYCEVLTRTEICKGHFNEEGNRIVAEIMFDFLQAEDWAKETDIP